MATEEPPPLTVTLGAVVSEGQQLEQTVTPPRYSVLDLQTNTVTLMSSHELSVSSFEDERTFRALANEWIDETGYLSDPTEKFMHPAHFKIVGMGRPVLPLLLKEVQKMSGHWFLALEAIAKTNPVKPEDEMSIERTANAWLEWGRRERLI